jgi:hypothetical protein
VSQDTDHIEAPTNGKGPHPIEEPPDVADTSSQEDSALAFTPAQLAIGFGIIASLLVLLVGRLRRRGGSRR